MRLHNISISFIAGLILLNGCGGGGGGGSTTPVDPPETNDTISITEEYQVESLGSAKTINATISLGTLTKDLYIVLSNSANVVGSAVITHNAKVSPVLQSKAIPIESLEKGPLILRAPQYVQDFSSKLDTLLSKKGTSQFQAKVVEITEKLEDIEGQTDTFCTNINQFT